MPKNAICNFPKDGANCYNWSKNFHSPPASISVQNSHYGCFSPCDSGTSERAGVLETASLMIILLGRGEMRHAA